MMQGGTIMGWSRPAAGQWSCSAACCAASRASASRSPPARCRLADAAARHSPCRPAPSAGFQCHGRPAIADALDRDASILIAGAAWRPRRWMCCSSASSARLRRGSGWRSSRFRRQYGGVRPHPTQLLGAQRRGQHDRGDPAESAGRADVSLSSVPLLQFSGRAHVTDSAEERERAFSLSHEREQKADPERKGIAVIVDLDEAKACSAHRPGAEIMPYGPRLTRAQKEGRRAFFPSVRGR